MRDFCNCRELATILFLRDLKAGYRMSVLGYLWLVLPPLVTTAIWFFLHSQRIIQVETEIPYPLFVLLGTSLWTSFAAFVPKPYQAFDSAKPVFTRIKVPVEAFVLSGIIQAGFELIIRLLLLIPVFILFGYIPHSQSWLAVLPLFALVSFGIAIGVAIIPLAALFGDVMSAVTTFLGVAMYASPVVYPAPTEDSILATVIGLNPVSPCITGFRDCLTNGGTDWLMGCLCVLVGSWIVILLSVAFLRVSLPHIVSRIGM